MICDKCSRQMWKRAPGEWVCKAGHVAATESVSAPAPAKRQRPWLTYGVLAALAADAVLHVLGVLT